MSGAIPADRGREEDFRPEVSRGKRALDLVCALAALPLLALGALAMTAVHALWSPGPVFYRQERIGRGGRRFWCYKFRTMSVGADSSAHQAHLRELIGSNRPMTKLDARGDARLIPGGWLLRASGLDELPQLINVLKGEMSVVGPRPSLPYEYEQFQPWQRERCDALPGLTGLWQVSGKNRLSFEEMVRLDIRYARGQSLGLDLRIIARTVPALLAQIRDTRSARAPRSGRGLIVPLAPGGLALGESGPKPALTRKAS